MKLINPVLPFALLLGLAACENTPPEAEPLIRPVRVEALAPAGAAPARTFSGRVQAARLTQTSFMVSGLARAVDVEIGQRVRAGTVLAALDPTDIELELGQGRASLRQAQAQLRNAEASHERVRALYEHQNASRQDYDAARAARDSARAQVAALRERQGLLERKLGYTRLVATEAGVVTDVKIEVGETVRAGQPAVVLQVGEALEVEVDVPEAAVTGIRVGGAVVVRVPALDDIEVAGVVQAVGAAGDAAATFPVRARLEPGAVQRLRPGMAAELRFVGTERAALPSVASAAVGEDASGRFVLVAVPMTPGRATVERRSVEVGEFVAGRIEISSGLELGELVVTLGLNTLQPGAVVALTTAR